ncbi:MAG: hypothetical protein EOP53_12535 [Sphingobacteriales bacterium]|nr:MAG: hypothetical protein EOP53_12535 [Sphingobacteriales bacterium]
MKFLSIVLLIFGLVMTSCKKEEPAAPPAPTKKEMISKTWKPKEVYINGQVSSDPYWSGLRVEIKQNGTYITTDASGATTGVWEFNSDETKIIFDKGSAAEETWDILSLSTALFKAKFTSGSGNAEILFQPS